MILLADGLPSSSNGHFEWITEDLSEGEWMLRATVTEQGTEKFVAYDRFYRFINHPLESASGDQGCTSVSVPRRGQGFTTADAALLISLLGIGVLRATCRSRRREVRTDRR